PGPFAVKSMDGSALECSHGVFDKTALVQRIGVDRDLHIQVIGDRKTAIYGSRSRTPVLVKLQAARAGFDLLNKTGGRACIPLGENTEIYRERVGSLEHSLNMPGSGRAGRSSRARRRPCPPAHQSREA